jgi:nicotinate-nucleotide adenylyltransferase
MRLGIFGGSFDPVHNAHLVLAHVCQRQAGLDEVWFTPTAVQPLKHHGPHATDTQRIEMLRLAIRDEATWRICMIEIDRGGLSYTVETLRKIHVEFPEADLFFLIGADAVRDIPEWKEPREIFRMATPLVVHRAGQPTPDLTQLKLLCTKDSQPQSIEMPESRSTVSCPMPSRHSSCGTACTQGSHANANLSLVSGTTAIASACARDIGGRADPGNASNRVLQFESRSGSTAW